MDAVARRRQYHGSGGCGCNDAGATDRVLKLTEASDQMSWCMDCSGRLRRVGMNAEGPPPLTASRGGWGASGHQGFNLERLPGTPPLTASRDGGGASGDLGFNLERLSGTSP